MKISTDACILGAWFAQKIRDNNFILDIGSSTGLLMLMLAQKLKSEIHGIEIDPEAFKQLKENVDNSRWKDKCRYMMGDVRTYKFPVTYDFILSNPPFFENQLSSPDKIKNIARHSTELNAFELIKAVDDNLSADGDFGLLLPYYRAEMMETLAAEYNFFLSEKLMIRHTISHDYSRVILHFKRSFINPVQTHTLTNKVNENEYSSAFTELMKDYYLKL